MTTKTRWWLDYNPNDEESLFHEARLILDGQPPQRISSLQRRFRIGFNTATRLQERLERARADGLID